MPDGDRERSRLGRAAPGHGAVADRVHRRAVGVVELHALMRLEVAAHRRAVAVGLVDVLIAVATDRTAKGRIPGGTVGVVLLDQLLVFRVHDLTPVRHRVDRSVIEAHRARMPGNQVGERQFLPLERRRGPGWSAYHNPARKPLWYRTACVSNRHCDVVLAKAGYVLVGQRRDRGVSWTLGRWTGRIDDGQPVTAIIGSDLQPVRSGDHRGVADREDPARRHVLPLGAELVVGPVLPGPAVVGREPPAVADGAVPDLAARPEGDRVHEVPGERVRRGVVLDPAPCALPGRVDQDAVAVGADPDGAVGRDGPGELDHRPAVELGGELLRGKGGGERQPGHEEEEGSAAPHSS